LRLKILKTLRTASFTSEFTGSNTKGVYIMKNNNYTFLFELLLQSIKWIIEKVIDRTKYWYKAFND